MQQARMGNLKHCYCKKKGDDSFLSICPAINNEFCHNVVKVAVDLRGDTVDEIHDQ